MDSNKNISLEKGSEAWNVAQGYTHLKILKPLVEMDKLVKVAIYGTESIEESFNINPEIKTQMKIEAIHRLIDTLREVIENSFFAMNFQGTKEKLEELYNRIKEIEEVLPGISKIERDQRNQESKTVLNDDHFWLCLEKLREIKKEIPVPLNQNSLIFPTSDEVDLEKLKDQLIYGG